MSGQPGHLVLGDDQRLEVDTRLFRARHPLDRSPRTAPARDGRRSRRCVERFDQQQPAPQTRKPAAQLKPQTVPSQVAKPFAGGAQAVHETPHEATLLLATQAPPQAWKPALQVKLQAVPLQVATALAGAGQAMQPAPQEETLLLETQEPVQAWKPALQVKPQAVPLQVAIALAGAGHAVHELPHALTLVLDTQTPLHRCRLRPQPFSAALSSSV